MRPGKVRESHTLDVGFRAWDWGLGFRVQGLGFRV